MAKRKWKSRGNASIACWGCNRSGDNGRTIPVMMRCGSPRDLCAECEGDYFIREGHERDAAIEDGAMRLEVFAECIRSSPEADPFDPCNFDDE